MALIDKDNMSPVPKMYSSVLHSPTKSSNSAEQLGMHTWSFLGNWSNAETICDLQFGGKRSHAVFSTNDEGSLSTFSDFWGTD